MSARPTSTTRSLRCDEPQRSCTETSALDQSGPVGSPRLTVQLTAPTASSLNPDTQLVVYAKLYDLPPTGEQIKLPNRLISPARVADPSQPFTLELPAIVHQFPPGHRLAVVPAGGDMAYRGSNVRQIVALTTGGTNVQQLTLPVVG